MKKIAISVIALSLTLYSCSNSTTSNSTNEPSSNEVTIGNKDELPIIDFEEEVHDFGKIVQGEKVSYDFKNMNLYVLIDNITNNVYSETFGVPMPKRWFHLGFTYKIGL